MSVEDMFYTKAAKYWENIPPTVDGMLGGYAHVSSDDIKGSKLFLDHLLNAENAPKTSQAIDCGAGIGRVSKNLLLPIFDKVDMVEQNSEFLDAAKGYLEEYKDRIGDLYPVGLQKFIPDKTYDVIWSQWVLGHLNEKDLVNFFVGCRKALNPNGILVVKENITTSGKVEKDEVDSSVTRPHKLMVEIFKKAQLKRIKECKQTNFPQGIYPVYMFALRPKNELNDSKKTSKLNLNAVKN